jgi:chitodextrinase
MAVMDTMEGRRSMTSRPARRSGLRARSRRVAASAALGALLVLAALVLLVASERARSATPNPLTLTPVADSYVRADQTGSNFGTQTALRADGSPLYRSYLRFNVQGLEGEVVGAVLRLRPSADHAAGFSVASVADTSWGETAITFANAPAIGAAVGASGPLTAGTFAEVDVTSLIDGNGLVSMAITTTSATAMSLASREAASNRPQLVISTAGAGGGGDTTAPSIPAGLAALAQGEERIDLSWSASSDDTAVAGYGVYRDGAAAPIATTAATSFSDTGLAAGSTHSYRVDAVDAAGNRSARSGAVSATTDTASGQMTLRLAPAADSYVRADQPAANFGTATTMRLDADPAFAAYLRFDVAGLAGPVSRALLRVRSSSTNATGYQVSAVADTGWSEGAITYANAPAIGSVVGSSGALTAGEYDEIDVTALVSGNGPVALALTTASNTAMTLSSREAVLGSQPELVITAPRGPPDTTSPSTPEGLSATAQGRTAIALGWSAASDDVAVTGYAVYRDGGATPIATTAGTSFTDTGLAAGSTHSYEVDAVDAAGNRSAKSASASAATDPPDTTPPSVPQNLAAAAQGKTAIALSWSASTDDEALAGYAIYRDGGETPIATLGAAATSFTDTGLAAGSTHSYEVDAVDAANNRSARSAPAGATTAPPDTTPPSVPQNLVAATQSASAIKLTWSASTDDEALAGYAIYRDGGLTAIATVGAAATSFTDTGLAAGSTHSYQVDAVDAAGNRSAKSASASATTVAPDTTAPSVPQNLAATAQGTSAIALNWSASTDAVGVTGYGIYRDGSATPFTTTSGTTFIDTGLAAGSTHSYRVDAVDAAGNRSARSTTASATTDEPVRSTSTFTPVADSYVRADQSGSNFGTQTALRLDASPVYRSYLRFNVQGLEGTVVGAVLRLRPSADNAAGFSVASVASTSWGETSITYANAPPIGAAGGASGPLTAGEYAEVDVTSLISGNGLVSMALTTTSATAVSLSSREAEANRPQLVITTQGGGGGGDVTPPSVPTGLGATVLSSSQIRLNWTASSDNVGVAGYAVYRDGGATPVGTTSGGTTFTDGGLAPSSTHSYRVDAFDAAGNRSAKSGQVTATTTAGGGGSGDPVIAAAGDIACDPTVSGFNINGTATGCRMKATSDLLLAMAPEAILALGDSQYENAAFSKYAGSFGPTWGRLKSLIRPAVGNHEYRVAGAAGHFQYFGAAAGDPAKGYYSFDVGAWHLIALNSECTKIPGGCAATGAQVKWLKADLAANTATCTLAYWHRPRFSSSTYGDDATYKPFWDALYAAGADVVLAGHAHNYERFALQDPDGNADSDRGIRAFVVGTGGKSHYRIIDPGPNSQVANGDTFGVLKLTLRPTRYDWAFIPEPGKSFTDSGSANCH